MCCQQGGWNIWGFQEFMICWAEVGLEYILQLSFLLRIEFFPTLTLLAPLPLLASLSNCHLCSGSQDPWRMPVLHNGQSRSLPECSTCHWCPAPLLTRTQCNAGP